MNWKNEIKIGDMILVIDRLKRIDPESRLTIHLKTGQLLEGTILNFEEKSQILLFQVATNPPEEIVYLPLSSISHFKVFNPIASIKVLSDNSVTRNPNVSAPSYLEVKRGMSRLFESITPKTEIEFLPELGNTEILNLQELLQSSHRTLMEIKADPLGEKVLSSLAGITIRSHMDGETAAKIENKKLVLDLNCHKALPQNLDQYLKNIIEKSL